MPRAVIGVLLVLAWLSRPGAAAAHHFTVEMKIQAGKASKTAVTDEAAPGVKPKERGVLHVPAKSRVTVKWKLTNVGKTVVKDVIVHFFAVKAEKVGQLTTPKLNKDVAAESALTMDFNPKDATRGGLSFTLTAPGVYLVRVETIGAATGIDGHEHFAALDLVVE